MLHGTSIIFDLEASCWQRELGSEEAYKQDHQMEVIEIGAVKVDKNFNVLDTFEILCKPRLNPILTEFCTTLTTIQQSDVDNAPDFIDAYRAFLKWAGHVQCFIAWGFYDFKQIDLQLAREGFNDARPKPYKNGKDLVKEWAGYKGKGLGKEAQRHKLEFEGIRHRGLADAKMVNQVLKATWKKNTNP